MKATKKKFRERGFFVYEDIEYLVDYLLKTHSNIASLIAKRFPFIIIDECQDLSYVQLSILNELHRYCTQLLLVGDLNQALWILVLLIIMSVVRQFIEPKIVSGKIGIHPIFTLIAMYTGFKFIGIIGMFVGPIILIVLKNIFATFIDKGVVKSIFER